MPMSSAEILEIRERQPRSLNLNRTLKLKQLKRSICAITGHTDCVLSKIAEGGFHRIYSASLTGCQESEEVIVRVAFDIPDFRNTKKMESEVATINWVDRNTNIPVPVVLFYDPSGKAKTENHSNGAEDRDEPETSVGAPYMLMRKIPGKTLHRMWSDMSEPQREKVVRTLAGYIAELLQTRFSSIGSLYQNADGTDVGPMIPICNPRCFRTDATLDSGPWATEKEFLLACIKRELQWISDHPEDLNSKWSSEPDSDLVGRYKVLFEKLYSRIETMECLHPGSGPFVLRHPDFHPTNIMVQEDDPSVIIAVIDWECANTAPSWAVAQIPEFLLDRGDEFERDATERASKARLRDLFVESLGYSGDMCKGQLLVALEEAAQTITTMREIRDMETIVTNLLGNLAVAGL
ncbi:kinase-like domain-containing protein [Mycena polygramma]|nr:kinase-like domain-containing protein [Mycena polygramma]